MTTLPDRCVTVSYSKAPYLQPAVYVRHTLKDGRQAWKYSHHTGVARRAFVLAENDALTEAEALGCPYLKDVRQWTPVEPTPSTAKPEDQR
jgi:hypothetical protein